MTDEWSALRLAIEEVVEFADSSAEIAVLTRAYRAFMDAGAIVAHTESTECWCRPRRTSVDPVTGTEVWVHGGAS